MVKNVGGGDSSPLESPHGPSTTHHSNKLHKFSDNLWTAQNQTNHHIIRHGWPNFYRFIREYYVVNRKICVFIL